MVFKMRGNPFKQHVGSDYKSKESEIEEEIASDIRIQKKYGVRAGEDTKAKCEARGGKWNKEHQVCISMEVDIKG